MKTKIVQLENQKNRIFSRTLFDALNNNHTFIAATGDEFDDCDDSFVTIGDFTATAAALFINCL